MRKFGKLASVAMLVLAAISIVGLVGCNQVTSYETNELNLDKPAKSAVSTITSFKLLKADNSKAKDDGAFENPNGTGTAITTDIVGFIDGTNIWLDFGTAGVTEVGLYKPAIEIAAKATISPTIDAVQYFGNAYSSKSVLKYTVTAEDGTTTVYTVADMTGLTKANDYVIYLGDTDATTALAANKQALTVISGKSITLTAKHPAQNSNKFPYMVKWSVPVNNHCFTIDQNGVLEALSSNIFWQHAYGYSNGSTKSTVVTATIYYKDGNNNEVVITTKTVNVTAIDKDIKTPKLELKLPTIGNTTADYYSNSDHKYHQTVIKLQECSGYTAKAKLDDYDNGSDGILDEHLADNVLTWTSSDPSIATVDNNGVVTAVNTGTVTIKAVLTNQATEIVKAATPVEATTTIVFTKQ